MGTIMPNNFCIFIYLSIYCSVLFRSCLKFVTLILCSLLNRESRSTTESCSWSISGGTLTYRPIACHIREAVYE